jgi:enediyne core biosynthesis thioesterase
MPETSKKIKVDEMVKNVRNEVRVNKKISAQTEKKTVTVNNISKKGGFINIDEKKEGPFNLDLFINNYKKIELKCMPKWSNAKGLGFEILSIEKIKENFFNEYIDRQIKLTNKLGEDRVFRTEIFVNLGETNATGNVYFSNFIKYQGVVRERLLVEHIPQIGKIMQESGIRLVTVDTYHKYKKNGYFGDFIIGELTVKEIKGGQAKIIIRFKRKSDGGLLGEGYQRFCCVDRSGKVMKMPKLFEFMEYYLEC